jgi:hypothetical protein
MVTLNGVHTLNTSDASIFLGLKGFSPEWKHSCGILPIVTWSGLKGISSGSIQLGTGIGSSFCPTIYPLALSVISNFSTKLIIWVSKFTGILNPTLENITKRTAPIIPCLNPLNPKTPES